MKPDVIINDISLSSLGWLRESISFPPVQSQTDTAAVPGRSSPIRFSAVGGRISWQPRTFKIILVMSGTRTSFMEMTSAAAQRFGGQLCRVTITEKPGVYALGTLQLDSEYDTSIHKGTLTISCSDADAYFYHIQETQKSVTGTQDLTITNDFMPVVPEITCTANTRLQWFVGLDQFDKSLSAGTWTLPELEFLAGENSLSIVTDGTVTVKYREGCL